MTKKKSQSKVLQNITPIQQELANRELARRRLLPFVMRNVKDYEPGWVHQEICEKLEQFEKDIIAKKSPRLMIFLPPRSGKALADSTEVITYNRGSITHGELQVDDLIQHPSGIPTKIVALSEKYNCEYEVTVSDGSKIKCHGNHEWRVYDRGYKQWMTRETRWFTAITKFGKQRKLHTGPIGKRGGRYMYQLPLVEGPIQMKEQILPLDPYFLGVWLGDGSKSSPVICYDPRRRQHIDKIVDRGLLNVSEWAHSKHKKYENVHYASFAKQGVLDIFREFNLYENKHIPDIYLQGSVDQRLELLAGLIDSDGCVDSKSRVLFTNTNYSLIEKTFELAQGLNLRPYWLKEEQPHLTSSGIKAVKVLYKIGFQPAPHPYCPPIPTVVKPITRLVKQRRLAITSVRKVTTEESEYGRCIQVAAKDGLYLAGKTQIPTHNSELASIQFPAWFLGRNPSKEIISSSYASSLSLSFSRKVRALLRDPRYQSLFPDCRLEKDSQSTEHWATTEQGQYLASGVGTGITGHGAHLLIIDDAVKDRISAESKTDRDNTWNWYSSTAYTRLMPGAGVLVMMTRWHLSDLAGLLLSKMKDKSGDDWEILTYPAIAVHQERYRKEGDALHPERYDLKALLKIKAATTSRDWGALYQQNPTLEEGAIIKRGYWNRWTKNKPPSCEYIIQSYDTAYSKSEQADYSSITTWGLFYPEGAYGDHKLALDAEGNEREGIFNGTEAHLILLDAVKGRYSFPELKDKAHQLYSYWQPDSTIIEAKATGLPLAHELRRIGVPVQTYTPTRGNDKFTRVHSVSDVFASGYVWAPQNAWADDLIEELNGFPSFAHDDQVDSTVQAILRFRQGGFVRLITDEDVEYTPRSRRAYY